MKRINFVLNALDGHSYKRIEEFKEIGYDVKVFGFDRGLSKQYEGIETTIIGSFPNTMPYRKRIILIFRALNKLFKETKRQDSDLWYYFGLQMAVFCTILNRNKRYLYEESDMTHLSICNGLIRGFLERINKRIILKSVLSVFTSEGFLKYHFNNESNYPNNVVVMPNKIHPGILSVPPSPKSPIDIAHLKFGFVGFIRYKAVYNMAEIISRNFPNHEFHFYGEIQLKSDEALFSSLKERKNVFFHGFFKNPEKLPEVYSNIDVVISTYDVSSINVKYAEPNKLYESIFFRTPIVVSEDTFLATQVERYKSGWSVDPLSETSVCELIRRIENEVINKTEHMNCIRQEEAIDNYDLLKEKLNN